MPRRRLEKQPSHKRPSHMEDKAASGGSMTRTAIAITCLVVAVCIGFKGYLETRVNTRFDNNKMVQRTGLDVPDRYWGSYRPGVYFGMKTRDPHSLVAGLMWYFPRMIGHGGDGIRHWCEQSDNLRHYTWTEHDGRNFGVQELDDGPFHFDMSFVKRAGGNYGGDWTARVSVKSTDAKFAREEVSLIWYVAIEDKTEGWIHPHTSDGHFISGIKGETSGLGKFRLTLFNQTGEVLNDSYLSTAAAGLHVLRETVINALRVVTPRGSKARFVLPGEILRNPDGSTANPNFVALQVTAKLPFEVVFVFESENFINRPGPLFGETYEKELNSHREAFHRKFDNLFKLSEKGWNSADIVFAKAALSNMLGGIGYFYGASRVSSSHTEGTVPYWKAPLYTAVPSRSFFPRGFLWDDAFHGLLIATWDLDIELDIMHHWFDLMNIEGWIPREQILGIEALKKVPEEFVTQVNTNANPPVFFLTLQYIIRKYGKQLQQTQRLSDIDRMYPRLQAWFDWFNTTQSGTLPGTYRWRGRDPTTNRELNPRTLTSGLDDYPRASHPTDEERHVDLRCWMAMAASTLSEAAQLLGRDGDRFATTAELLQDTLVLNAQHWSASAKKYADYGLHSDSVVLKRPPAQQRQGGQVPDMVRVVLKDPTLRYIDSAFGYVGLFPFLLEILPSDSPQLGIILKDLKKPELLWTNFGLRSLSTKSPLYLKHNTEHDPPYWRGAIWGNINFLAIRALKNYSLKDGPFREEAKAIYSELRQNYVSNVVREYYRSGFVWEQYNDRTGEGMGCRPFTGWTALAVLLMGEIY